MSAQGVDERMINVHYYYYQAIVACHADERYTRTAVSDS